MVETNITSNILRNKIKKDIKGIKLIKWDNQLWNLELKTKSSLEIYQIYKPSSTIFYRAR